MTTISLSRSSRAKARIILLFPHNLKHEGLDKNQLAAVKSGHAAKISSFYFSDGSTHTFVEILKDKQNWQSTESYRKNGARLCKAVNDLKLADVSLSGAEGSGAAILAVAEGLALANYKFLKYKSDAKSLSNTLSGIQIISPEVSKKDIEMLSIAVESTCMARDLVNEPFSYLNALQLSKEFEKMGKAAGFTVEVWNEGKIQSQKMGGLLAVNKGSDIPPTFNIMEYKPKNAKNKKPYVLVGKGVVYDTGGLSLKPTPQSMDFMKCDMAGAAVVAGTLYAIAKAQLPVHVVGLVPATDNWIGENSYAPGDVITMYSGHTVEVLNTDAEGRLILADALHYAKKLKPELVCDFATLTGAAVRAIGTYATAVMGTASDEVKQDIFDSAYGVYERLVEFPLWDDYADELKSDIADMTNLGKGEGGQISAAKFLEKYTDYPWMHFDIAGPAFNHAPDAYKPKGGTGVCVRLMFDFFRKKSN